MKKLFLLTLSIISLATASCENNENCSFSCKPKQKSKNPITDFILKKVVTKARHKMWHEYLPGREEYSCEITQRVFNPRYVIDTKNRQGSYGIDFKNNPFRNIDFLRMYVFLEQEEVVKKMAGNWFATHFWVKGISNINHIQSKFTGSPLAAHLIEAAKNKECYENNPRFTIADEKTDCHVSVSKDPEHVIQAMYLCQTKATYEEFLKAARK